MTSIRQICYRYALAWDSIRQVLFASNGNLLEIYSLHDSIAGKQLKLLNTLEIFSPPSVISGISCDDSYIVVIGGSHVVIIEEINNIFRVKCRTSVDDYVAAAKYLKNDDIFVVVTKKKLFYCLKSTNDGFEKVRKAFLQPVTTVFAVAIVGDTLENLKVVTGGIFGDIECFQIDSEKPERQWVLKAHDGMVFGIHVSSTHIYSVGDDRAIRIFSLENGKEVAVAYGHEDRIRGLFVDLFSNPQNPYIYTAGDTTCIWRFDVDSNKLQLVHSYESATGKVMAITVTEGFLIGCSVQGALFIVEALKQQMKFVSENFFGPQHVVRSFVKSTNAKYYVINDKKNLFIADTTKLADNGTATLEKVEQFSDLNLRYDTLAVTRDGNTIITSSDSIVYLIDATTLTVRTQFEMKDVLGGVCIVDDQFLLAVSRAGKAILVQLSDNVMTNFSIEKGLPIKSAATKDQLTIIGTANGYVSLYSEDKNCIVFSLNVSAKHEPVVDVHFDQTEDELIFYALTRNGICAAIKICPNETLEITETWSTIRTPVGFLASSTIPHPYIWGFRGAEFVVTTLKSASPLLVYECGGGNRIMNVSPTFENGSLSRVRFDYIVRGELKVVEGIIPKANFAVGPFHKASIYGAVEVFPDPTTLRIVTVGVDTQIILSKSSDDSVLVPIWRNFAHLSSIHCIDDIKIDQNTYIVTAGGRSEVRVWQVLAHTLRPLASFEGTPDYRVVSLKVKEDAGKLLIFAATSIRELQVFSFNFEQPSKLQKIFAFKCPDFGTFVKVAVAPDLSSVFAVGTSGTVYALSWPQSIENTDNSEQKPVYRSQKPGQSGALGLCSIPASLPQSNNVVIVGDDGGSVYVVDIRESEPLLKLPYLHASTVSDMVVYPDPSNPSQFLLASVSSDSTLVLTAISNDLSTFQKLKSIPICVGDVMSIRLTSTGCLIAGEGLQAVSFEDLNI